MVTVRSIRAASPWLCVTISICESLASSRTIAERRSTLASSSAIPRAPASPEASVFGEPPAIALETDEAHVVAPMTRLTSTNAVSGQIAAIASGGGTNLQPAFQLGREALLRTKARVKHMIILTDGQTAGSGYEQLATQCRNEGLTISTVAIGEGSHVALLQAIASSGGGQSYSTTDASSITRIFTQDTLMHTGRMIREEPFIPVLKEKDPMLAGFEKWDSPTLLGYVKTTRRTSAQVPLVTETGDPLLAHWRFGLGKATAFTSDAKSRWASLWIARWPDFGRFWSQVLRDTARAPQGRLMDLSARMQGDDARISVDLLADAGTRANNATVAAEVFHVSADALGAPMKAVQKLTLRQDAPGTYIADFKPTQAGVYLIRAQFGTDMVTTGLIHNPSTEASLGTINEALLKEAVRITSSDYLADSKRLPNLETTKAVQYEELWPSLLLALLLIFLIDTAIRRWEHVVGLWELVPKGKAA